MSNLVGKLRRKERSMYVMFALVVRKFLDCLYE